MINFMLPRSISRKTMRKVTELYPVAPPLPTVFSGSTGARNSTDITHKSDEMSDDQALAIVQQTINDHGQAMIAECGYRICTLEQNGAADQLASGNTSDPAIDILGRICTAAITNGAVSKPQPSADFGFDPSHRIFVFDDDQNATKVSSVLTHYTTGNVTVLTPADNDPGSGSHYVQFDSELDRWLQWLRGKPSSISLNGKDATSTLIFELTRPPVAGGPVRESAVFKAADDNAVHAVMDFVLVPTRDYFVSPPAIACGEINLNGHWEVDRALFQAVSGNLNTWLPMNHGPWDGGNNNGAPATHIEFTPQCPDPTSTKTSETRHFETRVGAWSFEQGGHHLDPNDHAYERWQPSWRFPITLSTDPRFTYTIQVQANTIAAESFPNSCTASLDAGAARPIHYDGSKVVFKTVTGADHMLHIDCDGHNVGDSWGSQHWFTLRFDIAVAGTKQATLAAAHPYPKS